MKQERIRQDRQRTGEGNSQQYKQVSHGATRIFDDVFLFVYLVQYNPKCSNNAAMACDCIWRFLDTLVSLAAALQACH